MKQQASLSYINAELIKFLRFRSLLLALILLFRSVTTFKLDTQGPSDPSTNRATTVSIAILKMALLFLKKKLFGAQDAERRESISSKSGKARCSESSPLIGKFKYVARISNLSFPVQHLGLVTNISGELAHDSSKCYNRPSDEESQIPSSQTSSSDTVYDSDTESERSSARSRIDARVVSDAIIGLSDGLTVPFALSAGLSAVGSTKIVILGGLAELVAGAISMGLGGYLGAISEA